jgi:hypothetical protein
MPRSWRDHPRTIQNRFRISRSNRAGMAPYDKAWRALTTARVPCILQRILVLTLSESYAVRGVLSLHATFAVRFDAQRCHALSSLGVDVRTLLHQDVKTHEQPIGNAPASMECRNNWKTCHVVPIMVPRPELVKYRVELFVCNSCIFFCGCCRMFNKYNNMTSRTSSTMCIIICLYTAAFPWACMCTHICI